MANTYTPNLNLTLMEVGANRDTWGATTNTNMVSLDSNLGTKGSQITALQSTDATHNSQISSLQTQVNNLNSSLNSVWSTLDGANKGYYNWVPIGTILLWAWNPPVPTGFAICDGRTVARIDGQGNITTPNLMGRFILADATPGQVGGNYTGSVWSDARGQHNHGAATGGHALTIAELPSHDHSNGAATGGNQGGGGSAAQNVGRTGFTGGNAAHTHPISDDGNHQHIVTMTIVPNYFTAIYIMRI